MSRRIGRIWRFGEPASSRPSKRIDPEVGSISFSAARQSVDLPQPDSPTSPSVSPRRTEKVTSSSALHLADLAVEDHAPLDREVLDAGARPRAAARRPGSSSAPRARGRCDRRRAQRALLPGVSQQRSRWPGAPASGPAAVPPDTCRTRAGSGAGNGSPGRRDQRRRLARDLWQLRRGGWSSRISEPSRPQV